MNFENTSAEFKRGFSVIEVMLAIALLVIGMLISIPFFANSLSSSELDSVVSRAVDVIHEARSGAMSGFNGGKFGVHFENDNFIFFEGDTFSSLDPNNAITQLSGLVTISDISITGGGADIIFAKVSGSPEQSGTIVFTESGGAEKTITINELGTVSVQ